MQQQSLFSEFPDSRNSVECDAKAAQSLEDLLAKFDGYTDRELRLVRLRYLLKKHQSNRSAVARELGMSIRSVQRWIAQYKIYREFPPIIGVPNGN